MNDEALIAPMNKSCMELDECEIRRLLEEKYSEMNFTLHIVDRLESTNDYVLERAATHAETSLICVANEQTAGRGRNGRIWCSPKNANIYMSIGRKLNLRRGDSISCLSIACGVALCRWLEAKGLKPQLKWPNDLLVAGNKLAGILIETRSRAGDYYVVIGVGLNVAMDSQVAQQIDQSWTDLHKELLTQTAELSRNLLVAEMAGVLIEVCAEIEKKGVESIRHEWLRYDCLTGMKVMVQEEGGESSVNILGLAEDCGLKVSVSGQERTVYAADIKLKFEDNVSD